MNLKSITTKVASLFKTPLTWLIATPLVVGAICSYTYLGAVQSAEEESEMEYDSPREAAKFDSISDSSSALCTAPK